MGNKYELLDLLFSYFPKKEEVDTFIDLFGGSGVVTINAKYENIIYNELNKNIYNLLKMLYNVNLNVLFGHFEKRIKKFDLSREGTDIRQNIKNIEKIRKKYQKSYLSFREFYNKSKEKDLKDLYLLTFYSFSNLIRFNSKEEFNMPYGNRCFTKGHKFLLQDFKESIKNKKITFKNKNAFDILKEIKENKKQFIYLDPPYSNTLAIYNESGTNGGWKIENDFKLFEELDRLNNLGIKWAMSNVLKNKGRENSHLKEWVENKGYKIIQFENKSYYSLGKGNANTQEVLIINYEPPFETYNIFDFIKGEK